MLAIDFSLSEIGPDKSILTFVACHQGPSLKNTPAITCYNLQAGFVFCGTPLLGFKWTPEHKPSFFCVFLLPGRGGGGPHVHGQKTRLLGAGSGGQTPTRWPKEF